MEKTTITLELPAIVELKINGAAIHVNLAEAHPSWLETFFLHGTRRKLNDDHSALKGQEKFNAIMAVVAEINAGKAKPERGTGTSVSPQTDPVLEMALKLAKEALKLRFYTELKVKRATIKEMVQKSDRIAAYFTDSNVWKDDKVVTWMESEVKKGRMDYMAQAEEMVAETPETDEEDMF